jgi:hypothetical protein
VLLLDEPTAALDPTARRLVEDLLLRLAAETDLTFVFVTNSLAQAHRIRDRGLLLVRGRVVDAGPLPAFLDDPASGDHAPLRRRVAAGRRLPAIAAQPLIFTSLAAALVLVGLALLLSWRQHLDIEKEMGFACIRAFVQLMAIAGSTLVTLGLLLALGIIPSGARCVISIAGMIVGNSINVASVTAARLVQDAGARRPQIEAALALGASPR